MDETETYIKMCDHPAIQAKWNPSHGDFAIDEDGIRAFGGGENRTWCRHIKQYNKWLPRLDQWIALLGPDSGAVFRPGTNESIVVMEAAWETTYHRAPTIEQAACLAYMAQHGFRWTDGGWEATK